MILKPKFEKFAVEILGLDLGSKLKSFEVKKIKNTIDFFGVVFIRRQFLNENQLIDFGEIFGGLEAPLARDQYGTISPKITMLSNVDKNGKLFTENDEHAVFMKGNQLWHTDSSYKRIPSKYSILAAAAVPSNGGETEFADARLCYENWSGPFGDVVKEDLEKLVCEHSIVYSRSLISGNIFSDQEKKQFEPQAQPLVREHPNTGRKAYYIGSHCSHIIGWPLRKSRNLIKELTEFCVKETKLYSHYWQEGDVVIWDNRSVLHRGLPFDYNERRIMRRVTVAGDGPLL